MHFRWRCMNMKTIIRLVPCQVFVQRKNQEFFDVWLGPLHHPEKHPKKDKTVKPATVLFLGVFCAAILRSQTTATMPEKPCPDRSSEPFADPKADPETCHKPQSRAVPADATANKPIAKPGPIRAEIALREGSMLRCDIPARSLP